jgi:hypothetical protein
MRHSSSATFTFFHLGVCSAAIFFPAAAASVLFTRLERPSAFRKVLSSNNCML